MKHLKYKIINILYIIIPALTFYGSTVNMPAGTTNKNYVTHAILKSETQNEATVNMTPSNAMITTVYYDGFGREQQTVLHSSTSSSDDVADFIEYDSRGRIKNKWLPCISGSMNGGFNPINALRSTCTEYYGDNAPYSTITYYNTVDERMKKVNKEGNLWHDNKGTTFDYQFNTLSGELSCVKLEVDLATGKLKKNGIYLSNDLLVSMSEDEDGQPLYKFIDKNDSTIMTRTIAQDYIDTYYVYDIYGNLSYVLPPMVSVELSERQNGIIEDNDEILQKYAYIYNYDSCNRCIKKKLPGAESIYMVYNNSNMLVLSQDGNQRARSEWTFFAYDDLGRLVYSGVKILSKDHSTLCNTWKTLNARTNFTWGPLFGYTDAFSENISLLDIKFVNFYDDYSFLNFYATDKKVNLTYSIESGFDQKYTASSAELSAKGMLTGNVVRMLDNTNMEIVKAIYYDDKGRVVQTREENHLGGCEKKFYQYSFTGNPLKYKHVNSTAPKNVSSAEEYTYTYDNWDRLLTTSHSWNGGDKVVLSKNSYNDLGQLSGVYINNKVSIGYGYDMHGWLTSVTSPKRFTQTLRYATRSNGEYGCMDGNICEMNWSADGPTLKNPNNPLGISRRYCYYYDNIDRLVEAKYSETKPRESPVNVTFENTPDYSTSYSYDLNSNITALTRKGIYEKYNMNGAEYWSYATADSLAYTLDGNRVTSINDDALCYNPAYNGAFDFPDITYSDDEYTYDANGNMTSDSNKDITGIEYNYLNLPTCITFADGHVTEYVYDAAGTKRRAIYKVQPETLFAPVENSLESVTTAEQLVVVSSKDYCDNHIYNKDGYLMSLLTDNGYIDGGRYHFYIKDYQGNNRVVFDQNGDVEQVNHYYPYGGTFGEGIGFNNVQTYKYGGKELDRMNGLDTYDFGARQLDSSKGSWDGLDPMAEIYHSISPYAYCLGNPIQNIDNNGLYPKSVLVYDQSLGKSGGYRFTPSASYLLSLVSGVNQSLIESTVVFERGLGQLPWYPVGGKNGGGAITLGNSSSCSFITFTENWFDDDKSSYDGTGYGQDIYGWLSLSSHEVGHIPQISRLGGFAGYIFKFIKQYSKYGHDKAPLEIEAEKGYNTFDDFNKFITNRYGKGTLVNLFKSNRVERQKMDMLTNWWNEYQKNKRDRTNDFYNNFNSYDEGTYKWGANSWIKQ